MKKLLEGISFFLALLYGTAAYAQNVREDVVYLKNGTVYRGQIVEQVFNMSVTIEVSNGEKHTIPISDVAKMTKEWKEPAPDAVPPPETSATDHPERVRKVRPEFYYPVRKFFFEGQVMGGFAEVGFRVAEGYRFGQFGLLGLGAGVDMCAGAGATNMSTDPYQGTFFPIYLYYSGDMLKRRLTPFYTFEAGYAFRSSTDDSYITVTPLNHPVYDNSGGFMGAAGFGLKWYTSHKVYVSWSMDLDVKQAYDKYSNYYINSIGENIRVSYSSSTFLLMPAVKISVGF